MSLIHKPLDLITYSDIRQLMVSKVAEKRSIEYKEELNIDSDSEKKKFLEHICSLANSGGGDILFGIQEKRDDKARSTGLIDDIVGIEIDNYDLLKGRIENVIQEHLRPRIRIILPEQPVYITTNRAVLIIRIPQSWNPPHAVWWNNVARFYARNSFGKYPLDVEEIRNAFIGSETARERMRQFRFERIERILDHQTPVVIYGCQADEIITRDNRTDESRKYALAILHLLPVSFFISPLTLDLPEVYRHNDMIIGRAKFSYDGITYFDYGGHVKDPSESYLSFFHNGSIEIGLSVYVKQMDEVFKIQSFADRLRKLVNEAFRLMRNSAIEPPCVIFASFLNCRGYEIHTMGEWEYVTHQSPIDRDHLILQDVVVQDFPDDIDMVLKPYYDRLWQSVGKAEAPLEWILGN